MLHMALVMDGKWHYCFPSIYLLVCTLSYPNYAMNTLLAQTTLCKKMIKLDWVTLKIRGLFYNFIESNPPGLSKRLTPKLLQFNAKTRREAWNYLMKFVFRLRFTRVFMVRAVHRDPFASLFICPPFSASFPNVYESNILWYSILFCARFSVNKTSTKQ